MFQKYSVRIIGILVAVVLLALLVKESMSPPRIDKSITYRIGYGNNVPFHFKEDDGEPSGLAYDLVNEAAQRSGIKLRWIENEEFQREEMDFWVLMTIKPDRLDSFHFTEPYLQTRTCFLVPEESPFHQLEDFETARISHANFGVHRENLAQYLPRSQPSPTESNRDAVKAMLEGKTQAAYMNQYAALRAVLEGQLSTSVRVIDSQIPPLGMAIASSFEQSEVADALREGMKTMVKEGSVNEILSRWDLFPNLTDNLIETLVSAERRIRILALALLFTILALALSLWLALKLRRQTFRLETTQESLRKSAEQYRAIVENTNDIVYSIDLSGRILFLGPQANRYGIDPKSAIAKNFMDFIFEEDKDRVSTELEKTMLTGIEQATELRVVDHNGTPIWFEESGKLVQDPSGDVIGITGALRDISGRKRAEEEQLKLEQQLRQSQKMEAIGMLAGGIAHDFNNILATMTMNLDLLNQEPDLNQTVQTGITDLKVACGRAAGLTRHLLTYSRRSVLDMKPLNLADVTNETLRMIQRVLGEDIEIQITHKDIPLPTINADPGVLEQVLMNLCVNARDAMPSGGQLTVSTELRHIDITAPHKNPDSKTGTFVCLTVADTGHGMDPKTIKQIFDPFFTTKDVGQGTGLGLSSVQGSIAQHGGWVEVESAPNKGARFDVYLPVSHDTAPKAEESPQIPTTTNEETILVVEDEPNVRNVVNRALTKLGYQVIEASNGLEALAHWKERQDEIDLLLTDVVLPDGVTGFELVSKLRDTRPDLKVIVSSGYHTESPKMNGASNLGLTYLAKPYSVSDLARCVRHCLETESVKPSASNNEDRTRP